MSLAVFVTALWLSIAWWPWGLIISLGVGALTATGALILRSVERLGVFLGAAALVVLLEIGEVRAAVDWWGVPYRTCGPGCVESGAPLSSGVPGLAYMLVLFALGAIFVYLAIRARRRRVTTR
jgi:hypothetical protein